MNIPLLVFADDWGRHPSSCQHLIRHLLPRHPTLWVNTIGTRAPRLNWATMQRAVGKFAQWFSAVDSGEKAEPIPEGLTIVNPKMWPWFTKRIDRAINRKALLAQLQKPIAQLGSPPIAITTLPIVADLMGELPVRSWVYYCVDDFGQWPGLDGPTLTRMEQIVVQKADRIISAGENLAQRMQALGRLSKIVTHGVDLEFWQTPVPPAPELARFPHPRVAFWGVVDSRLDVLFLRQLHNDCPNVTILLVGPEQAPPPEIHSLTRVIRIGALPFSKLPSVAAAVDVLIMPYADLPVTRAMQPLKLKEYLATGRPAVARNLPGNLPWADALDLVDNPLDFVKRILERIETGLPEAQKMARLRLQQEGWQTKAELFRELILEGEPDSQPTGDPDPLETIPKGK